MFLSTWSEMMILLFVFFSMFVFFSAPTHSLVTLLMIEWLVLFVLFLIVYNLFSLLVVIFFLTVSVCMGAYGASLLVSISSSKGHSQFSLF